MKNKIKIPILLILSLLYIACDDIFEEDITDKSIVIISPQNGDTLEGNTIQFLWNTIQGAENYNLQVYSHNQLVTDTTLISPPFVLVLNEGIYQWRIKGKNFAYQTEYTFPVSFEVNPTDNLTNQTVVLSSPSDNLITNNTNITFIWEALSSASTYSFEVQSITQSGNTTIHFDENLTSTSYILDNTVFNEDAQYLWRVKAVNETSATLFSSRDIFIDTQAPPLPLLLTPEFEEIFEIDEPINFSWNFSVEPGNYNSPITGYFEIATDNNFNTIVENGYLESTNFTMELNSAATYFWRIRGEDQAGNIGPFNQNGKFVVNE